MADGKLFYIAYREDPIVIVEMKFAHMPSLVLDWYAKEYDFERKHLSWGLVDRVTYPDNKDARKDDNKSVCDFT